MVELVDRPQDKLQFQNYTKICSFDKASNSISPIVINEFKINGDEREREYLLKFQKNNNLYDNYSNKLPIYNIITFIIYSNNQSNISQHIILWVIHIVVLNLSIVTFTHIFSSPMLGFRIRSSKNFTNISTLKLLYFRYMRSRLEYEFIIWSPYCTILII